MDNLEVAETITTPAISFNSSTGRLFINGKSIPENVFDFYTPVLSWIDEYSSTPNPQTVLELKLEYFNTSSSKRIFDIMKRMEKLAMSDLSKVTIIWYYEEDDEDIYFAGNDYKAILNQKVDFRMVEIDG
ncbi:MAG TPA: DUF1987 domain-containing protein [Williamwhitmania sp.]|jgi:hypothetical protein|nr:DUF1987 domain-containing protein [Williamwhitmania sp.]